MELDVLLADSAVTADGKLFVLGGGWNTVAAPAFPFRLVRLAIVILLREPDADTVRNHRLEIEIRASTGVSLPFGDPQSRLTSDAEGAIGLDLISGPQSGVLPGDEHLIPVAVNFDGLIFQGPDLYFVIITIDGQEARRVRFRVVESPHPADEAPVGPTIGIA
jgi:hypothetical protein